MKHLTKIILQKITFLLFKDNYCVCVLLSLNGTDSL